MLLTLINEKIFQQNTECDRLIKTRSRDLITGFRKDLPQQDRVRKLIPTGSSDHNT